MLGGERLHVSSMDCRHLGHFFMSLTHTFRNCSGPITCIPLQFNGGLLRVQFYSLVSNNGQFMMAGEAAWLLGVPLSGAEFLPRPCSRPEVVSQREDMCLQMISGPCEDICVTCKCPSEGYLSRGGQSSRQDNPFWA